MDTCGSPAFCCLLPGRLLSSSCPNEVTSRGCPGSDRLSRRPLGLINARLYETWEKLRASGTTPLAKASSPPKLVEVSREPKLIPLSPAGARRMLRVQGAEGTPPGSQYRLAFLTNAENGLAGAIDLARLLEQDEPTRSKMLTLCSP